MPYVDGFIVAVPKANLARYIELATLSRDVWLEHGALSYVECVGEDVPYGKLTSFPRAVLATEEETVVFAWITYPTRESRDAINTKVMADPRMQWTPGDEPFDGKRMIYGGFEVIVQG